MANFVVSNLLFVAMATRVDGGQILMAPLESPTPKTPYWVKRSCVYLHPFQSYRGSKFPLTAMQNFKFWGKKGLVKFFASKPSKEYECHQNASNKPLTATIGPTG